MANLDQLPWYSFSEGSFPPKGPRRRRKKPVPQSSNVPVELPSREDPAPVPGPSQEGTEQPLQHSVEAVDPTPGPPGPPSLETPTTSYGPSDTDSTQPTTPSSVAVPVPPRPQSNHPAKIAHRQSASVTTIIPAIPNIPLPSRPLKQPPASISSEVARAADPQPSNADHLANAVETAAQGSADEVAKDTEQTTPTTVSTAKEAPKSWADLVRNMVPQKPIISSAEPNIVAPTNGFPTTKTTSLSEALSSYSVAEAKDSSKIAFLEPRGLHNTGNMCYMNSVSPNCSHWKEFSADVYL